MCEVPPTVWEPDSTDNFYESNIRKQLSAFVGSVRQVSLQGVVLVVKATTVGFYWACYTEVMKFYTEPDTIG